MFPLLCLCSAESVADVFYVIFMHCCDESSKLYKKKKKKSIHGDGCYLPSARCRSALLMGVAAMSVCVSVSASLTSPHSDIKGSA